MKDSEDKVKLELVFEDDLPDIPDVDIEYQEDDGNSNCDGGGCTI